MREHYVRLVVVGDGAVGKTCLLTTYAAKAFPREYVPTICDSHVADIMVDGQQFSIGFFDTAAQEEYDRLRPLAYPKADLFFACFCVERPESLDNITAKWIPEVRHYCPDIPIVLVACKTDLRGSEGGDKPRRCVTYDEGKAVAEEIKAVAYAETSALMQEGLKELFDQAMRSLSNEGRCKCFPSKTARGRLPPKCFCIVI